MLSVRWQRRLFLVLVALLACCPHIRCFCSFHHRLIPACISRSSSRSMAAMPILSDPKTGLTSETSTPALPDWFEQLKATPGMSIVEVKEWMDERGRSSDGFRGFDFCHSVFSAVRILEYLTLPQAAEDVVDHGFHIHKDKFPLLVGAVYFSERAESHRGLCHGGSMCALIDDAIGWCGFCSSVRDPTDPSKFVVAPWRGFTAQVNCTLMKSVRVGSLLRLEAFVRKKEGTRKHWVEARLWDPLTGEVHCKGDGLFLSAKEEV